MFKLTAEQMNSFKWRVWNTFKSYVIPFIAVGAGILLVELQQAGDLSAISDTNTWQLVGYGMLMAILTALTAGIDKVRRMK